MFGMSRRAMAELLKKLEASGHISRRPSVRDSRVMMVSLTNRCTEASSHLLGKAPDQTSSMLDCLAETELQTLHGHLQRIDTSSDDLPASTAEDVKV